MPEIRRSELAQARAKLYQLLGSLYFKPHKPEVLESLAEWVSTQIMSQDSFGTFSPEIRQGLTRLDSFFETRRGKSWQELGETVSVEFTRLFRGVKKEYSPPPPYESVYGEEAGRVFGELTMEVYRQYRHFGFNLVDELKNEPPDHLSFELEFMYLMCYQEAEAWQENDEPRAFRLRQVQQEFCQKHLLSWLPKLGERISQFDRLGFFHGLTELTLGWVTFDYQQNLFGEPMASLPRQRG